MGSGALFARRFEKGAQRAKNRLETYLDEPENDENVHDIRTSLRRLEASFLVMPKKLRKRSRRQMDVHKQFFRANSRVRDYDIIRGRIAARVRGDLLAQLAAELDTKRKDEAARAIDVARIVSSLPPASLEGLDEEELESRMDKVVGRLVRKIKKELPVVVADKKAVEELHQLRKDLKKLRYVLEVVPPGLKKPYEKRAEKILKGSKAEQKLEELQDMLGEIHDIDITVQYLASLRKKAAAPLIEEERAEREELFNKFVKSVRS